MNKQTYQQMNRCVRIYKMMIDTRIGGREKYWSMCADKFGKDHWETAFVAVSMVGTEIVPNVKTLLDAIGLSPKVVSKGRMKRAAQVFYKGKITE